MFAVVRTGGKQYKVGPGSLVEVERLTEEVGASITLTDVLLVGDENSVKVGTPVVGGASVIAEVVEQFRDEKKIIFKKLRRKDSRLKKGHRQNLTRLRVTEVNQG
ncbi:UNVERIFIED_CONTAM: hypothetical protein GTU68_045920 [Idotea baltica]|nr:hypothetical protein [Idotea baltica]